MPRTFTLDEANALLPTLTADLRRLHDLLDRSRPTRDKLTHVEQFGKSNGKDLATELSELQGTLHQWRADAEAIVERIGALGCDIKDLEQGLIDFPSERDGRTVYLCWKLGEERISFWHELSTGFAGRQPL